MYILKLIGVIIFVVDLLIFTVGKKFFFIRLYFKDKNIFSQLFLGLIIIATGCVFYI
ncbi:hypothetical protein [Lactobacillus sp. S2-2]|uniref:hypothetical protein n=1 Tax=Lactobacillus sp. S2-2 TaxID=2692917 RepID=UPI001F1FC70B|nr:hypothetical protein [Lactobacillus sp. S2-2]